jgi:hypothetical protein
MGKVSCLILATGTELICSLVYPDNLKERLLQYIYSSMFFSDKEISSGVVNWSR